MFPFNLVNLVAGVTVLRLRVYVIGTAIGIVPATVLLAVSGGSIDDPSSPLFIGSVVGFVVLVVMTGMLARRLRPARTPTDDRVPPCST